MNELTEKVIQGLEICKADLWSRDTCKITGCPYADIPDGTMEYKSCQIKLMDDALSLLKAQEPRVMTLEEAIETVSKEGGFVWIEQKTHPLDVSHLCPSKNIWNCSSRRFVDYGKEFIPKKNSVRFMWRCWSSWPTDAQMKEVQWNKEK